VLHKGIARGVQSPESRRDAKEDAMRSETRTVHIAAPPEAVYEYVSGLEHLPDWAV
jgi:hypothetical protein